MKTVKRSLVSFALFVFSNPVWAAPQLVDDFDSGALASGVWVQALDAERTIENGRLVTTATSVNSSGAGTRMHFVSDPSFMQATVRVSSSSSISSGTGQARLAGYYYNDRRGPGSGLPHNMYEGNVWGQVIISLGGQGQLLASAFLGPDTADGLSSISTLFSHNFSTAVQFDTDYTMSIELTDTNEFIFTFNGESASYQAVGPMYRVFDNHYKQVASRVYAGGLGTLRAEWDDVTLDIPPDSSQSGGRQLTDDFSGTTINYENWSEFDQNRPLQQFNGHVDPVAQNLVIHHASDGGAFRRTRYSVRNTNLTAIQSTISILSMDRGGGNVNARLEGYYYNSQFVTADDANGELGEVWAAIKFGDRGSGPEVWWEIGESTSADFSTGNYFSGNLIQSGSLNLNTPYVAKIEYDGNQTFVFTFDGVASGPQNPGIRRMGEPAFPFQRVAAANQSGSTRPSISATFDDVFVDNNPTVYDDFSSGRHIDSNKWLHHGGGYQVANGKLEIEVDGDRILQGFENRNAIRLYLRERALNYVEAKVSIPSGFSLDPGMEGRARLNGYFYNARRDGSAALPYDHSDGDAWGAVQLTVLDDGTVSAEAYLGVLLANYADDSDAILLQESFTQPLALDTEYLLWMGMDGNRIVFGVDDETVGHTVTTPVYPPSPNASGAGYRRIIAEIRGGDNADPSGGAGYLKVLVDDIYTGNPATGSIRDNEFNINSGGGSPHPMSLAALILLTLLGGIGRKRRCREYVECANEEPDAN